MNILLTGATGFIGQNLTAALAAAGHKVIPVSRINGMDFNHMLEPGDWIPLLDGIDAVINAVGIIAEAGSQRFQTLHVEAPIALFSACSQVGMRRVIQISALGTDDDTAFSAYHLSKRVADDYLRRLDLDWFVLRPSLIYGLGGKSADLFMQLASLPLIPVIGDGLQVLQPVHISDVVAAVILCLTSRATRQTLNIVGTETVTFAEWLQMMRRAQGLSRARLIHIPYAMALSCAHVGRYFNPILQPENIRMLKAGSTADVEPLVRFLGRRPLAAAQPLFFSNVMQARSES